MSIYTLGIDIGSTASKCVMLKDGKEIVAKSLIAVGAGTSGPQRAIAEVLEKAGKTEADMAYTLATGYGRNSLEDIADHQMSELSCHAKGATFLFPDVHTVIDIGGQDVKVLQIDNGVMTNFVMNDKCAAGTGRFLDVMARVLEVKVEDLGTLGSQSTKYVGISSTCTVFAESEVISQLSMDTIKRSSNNVIDFMESEGYFRFKADYSISSKEFYDIYKQWCEDNACHSVSAIRFSAELRQNDRRYNLEATNNIYLPGGRRVRGFVGIEPLVHPCP